MRGRGALPLSAPRSHLECQLHKDDAPRQCPLQVVGSGWGASALKKEKGTCAEDSPVSSQHSGVLV